MEVIMIKVNESAPGEDGIRICYMKGVNVRRN